MPWRRSAEEQGAARGIVPTIVGLVAGEADASVPEVEGYQIVGKLGEGEWAWCGRRSSRAPTARSP